MEIMHARRRSLIVGWVYVGMCCVWIGWGSGCTDEKNSQRTSATPSSIPSSTTSRTPGTAEKKETGAPAATPQRKGPISFISEKIQINVLPDGKQVAVAARVTFLNNLQRKWKSKLYIPFFTDARHPWPDKINVSGPYQRHKKGIAFALKLGPQKEKEVMLTYRQPAPHQSAVYLVSSGKYFGADLDFARFDLVLPNAYVLKDSSFPLRLREKDDAFQHYRYEETHFTPDTDLRVSWRSASK